MKKLLLCLLILTLLSINTKMIDANTDYQAFEEIEIHEGKFLKDYTNAEYDEYYKRVNKRKFSGWQVYEVNKGVKVTYKTETIFSYYNDGTTPIEYEYKFDGTYTTSRSITSTGQISISVSGTVQKFKGGLDSSIKTTQSYEQTRKETESFKIKLQIDPGTMTNLYIRGEGKITNGVAKRYIFWIPYEKGGFEVFIITTQYYRLEKVQI